MKQLIATATLLLSVATISFASPPALAATVAAEPTLPLDIATREYNSKHCTLSEKKLLVEAYAHETDNIFRKIIVFSINGQKIDQREYRQTGESEVVYRRYLKNSSAKNWSVYDGAADTSGEGARVRMLAELGATREELDSCNKQ